MSAPDNGAMTSRHSGPIRVAALGLALATLGGCAGLPSVGPDYRTPDLPLPTAWQAPPPTAGAPQDLASWWRQLDDSLLTRLIDEALAGSLDLKAAQARLRQARASRQQALGGYFPSVAASGGASSNRQAEVINPNYVGTTYSAGFDASWEVDLFGGVRRGVEAATADQAASAATLNGTRVSLVAEVALNYVELRGYQSRLAIAAENLSSQGETLQIVEWRNQAGLASSVDVEQARANYEQTRASIPDLEIGLYQTENRLAVLLGRHPGALHDELAAVKPLPLVPASVATGIPADILRQRPDLIAAERTLAAETARVGQKVAARYPALSLSGSFGWEAFSFGALSGSGAVASALAGSLAATVFDGDRLRSAVDIQSAVQEQALIAYESGILTALEEVENALKAHAASRDRLDARQAAALAARNAAQLVQQQYQAGLSDFQKVLDTQRTRLTAEDNLSTAQSAVLTSLIKLYKALGGGWEQPVAVRDPVEGKTS
jgi:outer membrane protein, multidrug efflux system